MKQVAATCHACFSDCVLVMHACKWHTAQQVLFRWFCVVYVLCWLLRIWHNEQVSHEAVCKDCSNRFMHVGRAACCLCCAVMSLSSQCRVLLLLSVLRSLWNAAFMLQTCASCSAQLISDE